MLNNSYSYNTCLLYYVSVLFGCRILSYLDMKQIGRHYYNSKIPIHITQHRYTHTASCWGRLRLRHQGLLSVQHLVLYTVSAHIVIAYLVGTHQWSAELVSILSPSPLQT